MLLFSNIWLKKKDEGIEGEKKNEKLKTTSGDLLLENLILYKRKLAILEHTS